MMLWVVSFEAVLVLAGLAADVGVADYFVFGVTISAIKVSMTLVCAAVTAENKRPHNIGYLGMSFNVITSEYTLLDGFESRYLELEFDDNTTVNGFAKGKGFTATPVNECSTEFKCRAIETWDDYKRFLLSSITPTQEIDFESAYIASHKMRSARKRFEEGEMRVICDIKCLAYRAEMDLENPPHVVSWFPSFLKAIDDDECPIDRSTHQVTAVAMGARAVMQFKADQQAWREYRAQYPDSFEQDMKSISKWEGFLRYTLGGDTSSESAAKLREILTTAGQITVGSHYRGNMTADQWHEKTVLEGHAMPIHANMMPFEHIIDPKFVPEGMGFTAEQLAAKKERMKECIKQMQDSAVERFGHN